VFLQSILFGDQSARKSALRYHENVNYPEYSNGMKILCVFVRHILKIRRNTVRRRGNSGTQWYYYSHEFHAGHPSGNGKLLLAAAVLLVCLRFSPPMTRLLPFLLFVLTTSFQTLSDCVLVLLIEILFEMEYGKQ